MGNLTKTAAKTVSNVSDIDNALLQELHNMLDLVRNDKTDRVIVELRVKRVIDDEEAPEDSQVG
jgi:hypothetical protein